MTTETLEALATRCEAAKADEQWELLHTIKRVVWPMVGPNSDASERLWLRFGPMLDAGAFESAALMLVPEGIKWAVQSHGGPGPMAFVSGGARYVCGKAPALALAAASLRARAAQIRSESDD